MITKVLGTLENGRKRKLMFDVLWGSVRYGGLAAVLADVLAETALLLWA